MFICILLQLEVHVNPTRNYIQNKINTKNISTKLNNKGIQQIYNYKNVLLLFNNNNNNLTTMHYLSIF